MSAYRRGVRVTVTIAPKAAAALDVLLATGLFGRSRAGVAQEGIYRMLRDPSVAHFVRPVLRKGAGR